MDQRADQAEFLFHAAGKLPGQALLEAAETAGLDQFTAVCNALFAWYAEQLGIETDVLRNGQVVVQPEALRHVAQMQLGGFRVDSHVQAIDHDLPGIRTQHPGEHAHGGGFSGAIGTDQAQNLARLNAEIHSANGVHGAEALAQLAHLHGKCDGVRAHCPAGSKGIEASAGMPGSSWWVGLSMSTRMA